MGLEFNSNGYGNVTFESVEPRPATLLDMDEYTGVIAVRWNLGHESNAKRPGVHFGVYRSLEDDQDLTGGADLKPVHEHDVYRWPLPLFDKRLARAESITIARYEGLVDRLGMMLDFALDPPPIPVVPDDELRIDGY